MIRTKSSETDFVTDADLESELLIRSLLQAERPHDGILGEELDDTAGSSGLTWIVDPLDGTLNFIQGLPQWAVSIAAELGGEPYVGVVRAPALGLTYRAVRGCGAWLNGRQLRGSQTHVLSRAIIGTGFCYQRDARAGQIAVLARLSPWIADARILGAASLDLCLAAEGKLDGYCESGLAKHDYAAGALVATEAGLSVTVPGDGGSDWIVAAPPDIFAALKSLVSSSVM